MQALSWFSDLIAAFGRLIPRLVIVRATHGGVKWRRGKQVEPMPPGLHIVWPLLTEWEVLVTARQTLDLPSQVLMTKDRQQVVIGTLVVYRIRDIVLAIGAKNWDCETTIADVTRAAISKVVNASTLDELAAGIEVRLTKECRRQLRQFGVYVHRTALTDFSTCRVYKVLGDKGPTPQMAG